MLWGGADLFLGFWVYGCRGLGFRVSGFRIFMVEGFRVLGFKPFSTVNPTVWVVGLPTVYRVQHAGKSLCAGCACRFDTRRLNSQIPKLNPEP